MRRNFVLTVSRSSIKRTLLILSRPVILGDAPISRKFVDAKIAVSLARNLTAHLSWIPLTQFTPICVCGLGKARTKPKKVKKRA